MSIWSSADASRAAVACRARHHLLPQQAGDDGGAGRGSCEHHQTYEVGHIVAGRRAVIEEKQRRGGDRDCRADHARGKAAQRRRKGDDANEQRRGIGDGEQRSIGRNGDQRRRCRESRAAYGAPVDLHGLFSCLTKI
jgi:hypothetical protein